MPDVDVLAEDPDRSDPEHANAAAAAVADDGIMVSDQGLDGSHGRAHPSSKTPDGSRLSRAERIQARIDAVVRSGTIDETVVLETIQASLGATSLSSTPHAAPAENSPTAGETASSAPRTPDTSTRPASAQPLAEPPEGSRPVEPDEVMVPAVEVAPVTSRRPRTDSVPGPSGDQASLRGRTPKGVNLRTRARVVGRALSHSFRASRKTPCATSIGIFAVAFTVLGVATSQAMMGELQAIFFRTTELEEGENDFIFAANGRSLNYQFLNYTAMDQVLTGALGQDYSYTSPRHNFVHTAGLADLFKDSGCNQYVLNRATRYPLVGGQSACSGPSVGVKVHAIDSGREERMGLGREFQHTVGSREALIDETTARDLGVQPGDTIYVKMQLSSLFLAILATLDRHSDTQAPTLDSHFGSTRTTVKFPLTVTAVTDGSMGKLPASDFQFVMADINTLLATIVDEWNYLLDPHKDLFQGISLADFATDVYMNVPPNRADFYRELDYPTLQSKVVSFLTYASVAVGFSQVTAQVPLLESILILSYLTMFLGLIIDIIIFIFSVLAIMLLNTLVMRAMNAMAFDHGCMRMLGLDAQGMALVAFTQPLSLILPGIVIGTVATTQLYSNVLSPLIADAASMDVDRQIKSEPLVNGVLLALVIGVLSSAKPIYDVVSSSLRDTLDLRQNKTKAVEFKVERTQLTRVPVWVVLGGSVSMAYGVMIYLFLPKSLVMQDVTMLLRILFIILLGMLFGLVVLSRNVEILVQRLVINIFSLNIWALLGLRERCSLERISVLRILRSNLHSHRRDSKSTSMMYSIGLAFVLFITSFLNLQYRVSNYLSLTEWGAEVAISADRPPFRLTECREIEQILSQSDIVQDFAWRTMSLEDIVGQGMYENQITHLGRAFQYPSMIRGVSPNYQHVSFPQYTVRKQGPLFGSSLNFTDSELLYTARGSQSVLASDSYYRKFGMTDRAVLSYKYDVTLYSNPRLFELENSGVYVDTTPTSNAATNNEDPQRRYTFLTCAVLSIFRSYSGLFMSSLPVVEGEDTVVSFHTFNRILHEVMGVYNGTNEDIRAKAQRHESIEDLPMDRVIVKLFEPHEVPYCREFENLAGQPGYTTIPRDKWTEACYKDKLEQMLDSIDGVAPRSTAFDYRTLEESSETFESIITMTSIFISTIIQMFCFFSLTSSMLLSMNNQTKEIAILLALGMPKGQIVRVYVEEAFVVVTASSLLGILSGTLLAFVGTLQQAVMFNIPIPFMLPVWNVVATVIVAIISAFLSSYFPVRRVVSNEIVLMLR